MLRHVFRIQVQHHSTSAGRKKHSFEYTYIMHKVVNDRVQFCVCERVFVCGVNILGTNRVRFVNPARGQLNRKNIFFPQSLPVHA